MRKRFIQSHLALVDPFIAPSEYVKERYVEWGLDPARIVVEPQGITAERAPSGGRPRPPRVANRFAYFGQLNPYKGADVLLRAMDLLGDDFDGQLRIFGANLEKQSPELAGALRRAARGRAPATSPFAGATTVPSSAS